MSIINTVAMKGFNRFIVPCAGKMFHSSIPNKDTALCFVINKGYFETDDLLSMLSILDDVTGVKEFILVGKIEKISINGGLQIVYRQRLYFKSLYKLLCLCKNLGLRFDIAPDFRISINNVMNCLDDLVYLERYAMRFDESIDSWLTHCCIIELYFYLKSMNMFASLGKQANSLLRNKVNYLHRAPFLISSYNIEKHSSSIFLGFEVKDKRAYDVEVTGEALLAEGYTTKNVEKDKKEGVLD
jgi:hypothetical protein